MFADIIPSHDIAYFLLKYIDKLLDLIGLKHHSTVEEIIYVAIIVGVSLGIGWLIKKGIIAALRKTMQLRSTELGHEILQQRTLERCSHIIPPLVFLALLPFAFSSESHTLDIIERLVWAYVFVCVGIGVSAVINLAFYRYNTHENTRNLPLKGIRNVAKGLVWIIIIIVGISIIVDRSPAVLLTGLGAFAAALMLIFKDSILGFVAGIQMSQNDMLHVGDWIVVPSTPANGTVEDVSLSVVKIRNFDNTIVTVPPYTLVSTSFQNYRGMKETGARRIEKNVTIDATTVRKCTPEFLTEIVAKYPILKPFVDNLESRKLLSQDDGGIRPINGTIETNLGLLRAYLCIFLTNNDMIAKDQQILIRLTDVTAYGLSLQVYCFTATTDWNKYEAIQSAILEHLTVTVKDFGLDLYSDSTLSVTSETPDPESVTAQLAATAHRNDNTSLANPVTAAPASAGTPQTPEKK